MAIARGLSSIVVIFALASPVTASRADQKSAWVGVWTGLLGNASTISVTIKNNGAVNYVFRGATMPIAYSRVSDDSVSFGDRDHYNMTLTRTGANSVMATYHGRNGYATAMLAKR